MRIREHSDREAIRIQPLNLAGWTDQNRRWIARLDIRQYGRIGVVRGPKQSRVAIVAEAACELLIEYFNGTAGRCARARACRFAIIRAAGFPFPLTSAQRIPIRS